MKSAFSLAALMCFALTAACTPESRVSSLPPGKYEKSTTTVDASGTKVEKETSTDVQVDAYGNKRAIVETETSTDPRGLFNKRTTKSKQVIQEERY